MDARTRFCVQGLANTVANDTRCLRRLETLCAHLHQYPYAKVEEIENTFHNDIFISLFILGCCC